MRNHQAMELNPLSSWGFENILMEWANVNLMNGLWKGALSAAQDVSITSTNVSRGTDPSIKVQGPKIDNLPGYMRRPRNTRGNNGCGRLFPPNGEGIRGGDDHAYARGKMGSR